MQLDTLDTATLNKLIQNKINFSIKTENLLMMSPILKSLLKEMALPVEFIQKIVRLE